MTANFRHLKTTDMNKKTGSKHRFLLHLLPDIQIIIIQIYPYEYQKIQNRSLDFLIATMVLYQLVFRQDHIFLLLVTPAEKVNA